MSFFFFFNDTATTEIYTLSLHDALPISHLGDYRDHHFGIVRDARRDGGKPSDRRSPALRWRGGSLYRQPVPAAFFAAWTAGRRDRRRHGDAGLRVFPIDRPPVFR